MSREGGKEREISGLRPAAVEAAFGVEFARVFGVIGPLRFAPIVLAMSDVQHETVHFTGHVQGVGFRYTTLQVAREYEVTGFVRNLPDGRVHLEAEGTKSEIEAFLKAVADAMPGYIRKTERTTERRTPQFQGFTIR